MFTNLGYQGVIYDHIVIFMKLFSDFRLYRDGDDYITIPIAFEDKDNHYKSQSITRKTSKIERTLPIFVLNLNSIKLDDNQINLNKYRICEGVEVSANKRYSMELTLSIVTQQTTDMLNIIEALASKFRPFINATMEYEINGVVFTKSSEISIKDEYNISHNHLKSFSDISTKLCTMDVNFNMPLYIFDNYNKVSKASVIKSVTIDLNGDVFKYSVDPKDANKSDPHNIIYNEK